MPFTVHYIKRADKGRISMPTSLAEIAEGIRSNPSWRDDVLSLRAMPRTNKAELDAFTAAKEQLAGYAISASFKNKHREVASFEKHNGLIALDVDKTIEDHHPTTLKPKEKRMTPAEARDLVQRASAIPYVVASWLSASGRGCIIIVNCPQLIARTDAAASAAHANAIHKAAWQVANNAVAAELGSSELFADNGAKDIARFFFVSHDPEAYYNDDATELDISQMADIESEHHDSIERSAPRHLGGLTVSGLKVDFSKKQEKPKRERKPKKTYKWGATNPTVEVHIRNAALRITAAAKGGAEHQLETELGLDGLHPTTISAANSAFRYVAAGLADAKQVAQLLYEAARSHPDAYPDKDIIRDLQDAYKHAKHLQKTDPYIKNLHPSHHGRVAIELSAIGFSQCLAKIGIQVRRNDRSGTTELRAVPVHDDGVITDDANDILRQHEWHAIDDVEFTQIIAHIENHYVDEASVKESGKALTKAARFELSRARAYLMALSGANIVDPFIEWLESLPEWDGKHRLDRLIPDLFDVDYDELGMAAWCGSSPYIVAVRRAYEPSADIHEVPVLVGAQNCGKSTLVSRMLPAELRSQLYGTLTYQAEEKKMIEQTRKYVIIEWDELGGVLGKKEGASVKAWITRSKDNARAAYGHFAEDVLRRFAVIATANNEGGQLIPFDASGHRRWAICEIKPRGDEHHNVVRNKLEEEGFREQLWAEAIHRYKAGETGMLPAELRKTAASTAEKHSFRDEVLEARIIKSLPKLKDKLDYEGEYTADQLIEAIIEIENKPGKPARREPNERDIRRSLVNLGAESRRKRANGRRLTFYTLPPVIAEMQLSPEDQELQDEINEAMGLSCDTCDMPDGKHHSECNEAPFV